MPDASHVKKPKIVAITNQSPDWSDEDIYYGDQMWQLLLDGLEQQGYVFHAYKFHDDLSMLDAYDPREWLVWNWGEELAGRPWSSAAVAQELERRGFVFTGSDSTALDLTRSRAFIKERLTAAGVPTLPYQVLTEPEQAELWTTYPAIAKGANQHASFGITGQAWVDSAEALAKRVAFLRETYQDDTLVEPFLDTREFQVAVWGNHPPRALPPTEFDFSVFDDVRDRIYSWIWKFDRGSRGYREIRMPCPAPLDRPDWMERLQAVAVAAYQAVDIRDYGRVDMRMLGDEPQVLDVNANPDLDHISVVLAGARTCGMDYGGMVDQIIRFAVERMPA